MNEPGDPEEILFDHARRLADPHERALFLDAACRGDTALRRRLDALIASHPDAEAFFASPPADASRPAGSSNQSKPAPLRPAAEEVGGPLIEEGPGAVIGRYRLLEKIGEGGFGIVYMAEQKEPVKRRVALKIIKLGMDTRQVVARFEAERQALALMDHPNIAKVFDAGATVSGRPFFVMELVRGTPITQFCDESRLPPAERLTLLAHVCRAIHHAHQKGIIHRDIKPSNILVTLHDGVPVPKVIDFGIAKATQRELTEKTLFTQFQLFVGTPAYMSPEQAERSGLDIDTRSDIYSLGVLLYELLTGKTPFDGKKLLASGLEEMRRTIREEEPVRPSTRLSTMAGAERLGVATQRRSESSRLVHLLRGDLDWIVMKCLEKDRTRRYESANSLALDLERHLENEPVEARPPGRWYRLQKFARRNKVAFATAALTAAALLVGAVASLSQAIRASKAEQAARRIAYIAEMSSAGHALAEGNLGRVRQLLANQLPTARQPDLRGWEWRYLANRTRGEQSRQLLGHSRGVSGLHFLDDHQLLSVGWDRRAIWWDVDGGRAMHTLILSNFTVGLAVTADHHLAALAGRNSSDVVGNVTLLDLDRHSERTTRLVRPLSGDLNLDLSPSGELVLPNAANTGPLALWDVGTEARLAVLADGKDEFNVLRFSPDGRHLAAATREGWIQIWDVAARSKTFSWPAHAPEGGFIITINTLAFSPSRGQLVSAGADRSAAVWDFTTGARLTPLEGHHGQVQELAFSPDGRWLAAASLDHTLYVWETASWRLVKAFHGHSEEVRRVAWSPNGRRLASGGPNGELLLWDWPPRTNAAERIEFSSPLDLNLSETGDTLLRYGGVTNPIVEFWDTKTLTLTAQYPTPDTNIFSGWHLPGGRRMVTGDRAGRVGIWDPVTGRELWGTNAHKAAIYGITGSADGRVIVTFGLDGVAMVWDLPALTLRLKFQTEQPFDGRAVTTDGAFLAIGYPDGRLELRDLLRGQRRVIWQAHDFNFKSLAFSPDGTRLASSCWDRTGRVWDVARAELLGSIGGNLLAFESLAFSPDGSRLAAGTGEGTVKLYDVQTAQEVATFSGHRHAVYALAFIPDGTELVSASLDALCVWRAPDFPELKEVEARLNLRRPTR